MFKNLAPEIILSIGILHLIVRDCYSKRINSCFHWYIILAICSIGIECVYEHTNYIFKTDQLVQCLILGIYVFYDLFLLKKCIHDISIPSALTLTGCLHMVSAANFLDFFLGAELAVLPTYIITHVENESIKNFTYFCYGIIASATCVFGISLIYSATGTFDFFYINLLSSKENAGILRIGSSFLFLALCVKFGIFPFQKWFTNIFDLKLISSISIINIIYKPALAYVGLKIFNDVLPIENISFFSELFVGISIIIFAVLAARQTDIIKIFQYIILEHSATIIAGWHGCNNSAFLGTVCFIFAECIALCSLLFLIDKDQKFDKSFTCDRHKILILFICIAFSTFPPFLGFFGKFHILISMLDSMNYILFISTIMSMFLSSIYIAKCVKIIWKWTIYEKSICTNNYLTSVLSCSIGLLSITPLLVIIFLNLIQK